MSVSRICKVVIQSLCLLWLVVPSWSGAILKPNGADAMPIFTRSITARAEISGQFARTTLVMLFQNESSDQIEADFIYALQPGAVATYFAYWADAEKVEARIVEKREATRIYKHLTEYARDPALVEFTGKNTFRARISPVFANQDLKVEIRYVQVLQSSGDSVSYSIPISPADAEQSDPLESIDVMVRVQADERIRSVSNNYGLPATRDSGNYVVAIKGKDYRPRKDLSVRVLRRHAPLRAELQAEPGTGHFSLALTPDQSLKHPRLSISGVQVTQIAPARLPNVRAGHAVVVQGRYRGGGKACVTLRGQSGRTYSTSVDFGAASPPGIATKLWAASRMADLGRKRSNRKAVVKLSFSYGLPSRYTSWLAVPKAETKNLDFEKAEPKMEALAQRMAGLVADGKTDSPEYRALQAQWEEIKDDERYSWVLLSELERKRDDMIMKIMAIRSAEKPEAAGEAEWKAKAERVQAELSRLSVRPDGESVDALIARSEQWRLEREYGEMAVKLARLIVDGESSTKEAEELRAKYQSLGKRIPAGVHGDHDPLSSEASYLTRNLAWQIVDERHSPKPRKGIIAELNTKLQRIAPFASAAPDRAIGEAEKSWAGRERRSEAEAYADAVAQGDTRAAQSHLRRYNDLSRAAGAADSKDRLLSSLRSRYDMVAWEYCAARNDKTVRPSELRRIRKRAERLAKLTGNSIAESVREREASWAAEEMYSAASLLSNELDRQHPFRSRVMRLRKSTGTIAAKLRKLDGKNDYAKEAESYNAVADEVISAWLEEQKLKAQAAGQGELEKAATARAAATEKLHANIYYIRRSARGGDPLISVAAPEDALRVIALLPDGDVKALAWNPANNRWEARFDIPTGTPDGDYTVTVVAMLLDGTRSVTSVNYGVDNTPPSGSASAVVCDRSLRLEVRPNEEAARVVALLAWGQRVELRKSVDGGAYRAIVPIPVASAAGNVEFVLTDNAHNRASVFVDTQTQ